MLKIHILMTVLSLRKLVKKIKDSESHLHIQTAVDNATDLIDFLIDKKKSLLPENGSFLFEDTFEELLEFDEAANAVERVRENKSWDPWFDAHKRLPRSSVHAVTVINIVNYGTFVEFNDGMVGLVHTSNYRDITVSIGDQVEVEIIWVDAIQKRMSLAFISVLQEDAGDVFHS